MMSNPLNNLISQDLIHIECVIAFPDRQCCYTIDCHKDTVLHQALELFCQKYPDHDSLLHMIAQIKMQNPKFSVGIFSQHVNLEHDLKDQDRIEIYRALTIDPKVARARRAEVKIKKLKSTEKNGINHFA